MAFSVILLNALRNSRASTVIDVGTVCPYMTAGILPVPRSLPATLLPPPCRDSTFSFFASILRNSFVYKNPWYLGRQDSNLRLPDPNSGGLPLADVPMQFHGERRLAKCRGVRSTALTAGARFSRRGRQRRARGYDRPHCR